MLITDSYRKLNQQLHQQRDSFGTTGSRWADAVVQLAQRTAATSILDYGAGKGTLARALAPREIRQYDPAILGLDTPPEPADLVVCTDVLEHVEYDCLDTVLDHLLALTQKAMFLTVATRPAITVLPDGRNAHLIQESLEWWLPRIWQRFQIRRFDNRIGDFLLIAVPHPAAAA